MSSCTNLLVSRSMLPELVSPLFTDRFTFVSCQKLISCGGKNLIQTRKTDEILLHPLDILILMSALTEDFAYVSGRVWVLCLQPSATSSNTGGVCLWQDATYRPLQDVVIWFEKSWTTIQAIPRFFCQSQSGS